MATGFSFIRSQRGKNKLDSEGYIYKVDRVCFCFVALPPKSTAMVIAGRSVHLTTLFPGQAEQAVNQYFVHILSLVTDNNPS